MFLVSTVFSFPFIFSKVGFGFCLFEKTTSGIFFFFFLMSGCQVSRNEGRINLGPFSSNCMDAARSPLFLTCVYCKGLEVHST